MTYEKLIETVPENLIAYVDFMNEITDNYIVEEWGFDKNRYKIVKEQENYEVSVIG